MIMIKTGCTQRDSIPNENQELKEKQGLFGSKLMRIKERKLKLAGIRE